MHDGISFEQLGKPAVVVCTSPFESNARNLTRVMGLSEFPVVFVDHPIGSLVNHEIKARAAMVYSQALKILLDT